MSPRGKAPNIRHIDPLSFGGQLRRFREEAGLSQEELGAAIGLNQQRISLYERNINIPEQEDVIVALADALGIAPSILFEATRFNGALVIGTERRERLKHMDSEDWRLFDHILDAVGDLTPEEHAKFRRAFENFLPEWKEFAKR